ncbi:MAG: ribose 5-phosphate isomerase B [Acidobacteriia bacterium]|nr:ribose 5-phosphate isomerase B [Terriglobia bacterium]
MKIAVGSDHAGFQLKGKILQWLKSAGHEVEDVGTYTGERCDYPDFAKPVAERVSRGQVDRGVLVCGSGIGMSIAANKFFGVRAAECFNVPSAEVSRAHNDANILCLGERMIGEETAKSILETWLATAFEGGRHIPRLEKIKQLERENLKVILGDSKR